jgi:hypothetical protein
MWLPAIHPRSSSLCYFGSVVAAKLFSERCWEEPIFQSQQEAIWTNKMHLRSRELVPMQRFDRNRTPLSSKPSLLQAVREGLDTRVSVASSLILGLSISMLLKFNFPKPVIHRSSAIFVYKLSFERTATIFMHPSLYRHASLTSHYSTDVLPRVRQYSVVVHLVVK